MLAIFCALEVRFGSPRQTGYTSHETNRPGMFACFHRYSAITATYIERGIVARAGNLSLLQRACVRHIWTFLPLSL